MRRYKALPVNLPQEKVDPIPLTAVFYEQLQQKYQRLQKERGEAQERLQTAREMGDLSENGAYKYAKFELGSIGRQLKDISFLLKHGYVAQPAGGDMIGFGSVVELQDQEKLDGPTVTYTLLSQYEADPSQNKISLQSPLGQQLQGKKVGQEVRLNRPKMTKVFKILSLDLLA